MHETFKKDLFISGNLEYFKIPIIKNLFDDLTKKYPRLKNLTVRKEDGTTYLFVQNSGRSSEEELARNIWTSCGDLKAICKRTAIAF